MPLGVDPSLEGRGAVCINACSNFLWEGGTFWRSVLALERYFWKKVIPDTKGVIFRQKDAGFINFSQMVLVSRQIFAGFILNVMLYQSSQQILAQTPAKANMNKSVTCEAPLNCNWSGGRPTAPPFLGRPQTPGGALRPGGFSVQSFRQDLEMVLHSGVSSLRHHA